jgi:hypothetical protein
MFHLFGVKEKREGRKKGKGNGKEFLIVSFLKRQGATLCWAQAREGDLLLHARNGPTVNFLTHLTRLVRYANSSTQ